MSPAISLHLTMWYFLFSIWSFLYLLRNLYPELSVLHSLQYWKECKDRQLWVEIASYYPFLHSFPVVVKSLLPDCPIPLGRIMVFNATFNNNPAISWHSVLLVEEIRRKPPICCKSLTKSQLGNAHHQPIRWVQWCPSLLKWWAQWHPSPLRRWVELQFINCLLSLRTTACVLRVG